ncbi:MAG: XdhC family protein [Anaerolineales bacterium]|jgi:xanthine dehydrogenase accessory factor|nr:XdhC family protein [Anaerolineales bacterium]MDX9935821.1 XdhC family protein [Anaerolineales bacterium]GER79742.1 xanthine and CO dehydrogenase maturation factor, XdhC/CoxF family [Candidatus Denitrolinea symbiosum]HPP63795.1 XdhC family protein [Anaerolineales bacterium]
MNPIFQALVELESNNESAALCTVVKSQGSTPRHVGSKMLVYPDGRFIGSVGGGDLEHRVLDEAWMALADGQPRYLHYNMSDPSRGDPGVCGGQVEVFVEPILPPAMVIVVGAGHVGKAVAHLAKWLGFRVAVSDDRVEFCNAETVPEADAYYPVPMEKLPDHVKVTRQTYLVLTTRGVSVDAAGLAPLLETEAAYIGVIGSKRRWLETVKAMTEKGVPEERLARVHSPIGLELQAETPEEIAVSIMAEILMVRNKATGEKMSEAGSRRKKAATAKGQE